jgi:apolipoprotein N-acyltransferase
MIAKIPLLPVGQKRAPTFYHRYGDWFGWGCVILIVATFTICSGKRGYLVP